LPLFGLFSSAAVDVYSFAALAVEFRIFAVLFFELDVVVQLQSHILNSA
jgi:hypothetical protein